MKKIITLLLITTCLLSFVACTPAVVCVEGKIIAISETGNTFTIVFDGATDGIAFKQLVNAEMPFKLLHYYRIKYKTGSTAFNPCTVLEYQEIYP